MTDTIKHEGVIVKINDADIQVKIVQTAACSACSAKGYCSSSESKEKYVDIPYSNTHQSNYQVGDQVMIVGESSMGLKAVLLAFVFPFIFVIAFLFLFMELLGNEAMSALLALACLIPYYLGLWLMRNYIKNKFIFKIKPIK